MSVFTEKMTDLGYQPLIEDEIAGFDLAKALSNIVEYKIPDEYLEFLSEFPVAGGFSVSVSCSGIEPSPVSPDACYHLSGLYGYCSIDNQNVLALRKSPPGAWDFGPEFLAIGGNTFGNHFCLKLQGENVGAVYYWEHDPAEGEESMFRIAPSFTSFIDRLQEEPEEPEDIRPKSKGRNWLTSVSKFFGS